MCLLSVAPVAELGIDAAAALLDLPERQVYDCLREFERAGLIYQRSTSRYSMHPLVRLFWVDQVPGGVVKGEEIAAVRRLVIHLLGSAWSCERLLFPQRPAIELGNSADAVTIVPRQSTDEAMRWFDAESTTLVAAQRAAAERGWHALVWQLAWSADTYLYRRGLAEQHERMWQRGLAAAEQLGDSRVIALAELCLGRVTGSTVHLERALRLIPPDDPATLAQAHRAISLALESDEDLRRSLHHAVAALRLFRGLDMPVWEATQLNAIGEQLAALGHPAAGREFCGRALLLHQQHEHLPGVAAAEDGLGTVERLAGDVEAARRHYVRAVEVYLEIGHKSSAADTLLRLGQALAPVPRERDEAGRCLRRALSLFRAQRRAAEADRARAALSDLERDDSTQK